jgi:hypothetical protein
MERRKMAVQKSVVLHLVVVAAATVAATMSGGAQAFVPVAVAPSSSIYSSAHQQGRILAETRVHQPHVKLRIIQPSLRPAPLFMSTENAEEMVISSSPPLTVKEEVEFNDQEVKIIEELYAKAGGELESSSERIQHCLTDALPNLAPKLVLKLRQAENHSSNNKAIGRMATELNQLLELRMKNAKATLQSLLQAGEIRKLDNLIGKAARNGELDVSFFNVLSYNLKDAAMEYSTTASSSMSSQEQVETQQDGENDAAASTAAASRLQILQHIYTRCQEEVEKNIPPGSTLLNKLLRTREDSIRANLYRHYLTIQETNTIVTPDGVKLEIKSQTTTPKALVSIDEFCSAIALAVQQVRTVEQANGMDKASAANMVETCRQIAKEARGILGQAYGVESTELQTFETSLQPVFRPTSTESPYIKGTD